MSIRDDIARLADRPPAEKRLDPAGTPKTIPARTGLEPVIPPSTGGGIASPLTETVYSDRTFWPEQTITSSDGVFTVAWAPIRVVKFLDALDNPVVMEYKEPV